MLSANPLLIGFAGKAQSGKTTSADYLCNNYGFVRLRFAQDIKAMLVHGLGLTWDDVDDPKLKVTPNSKLGGKTPREAMVSLGLWGRTSVGGRVWSDRAFGRILKYLREGSHVVVDDVRLVEEANLIHSLGGHVVRLHRGTEVKSNDALEAQGFPVPHSINNSSTVHNLMVQLDGLMYIVGSGTR